MTNAGIPADLRLAGHPGAEFRSDDAQVPELVPPRQLAGFVEEREPSRSTAPARRAVDLAVRKDGHVPLDQPAPASSRCQKMTP